MNDDVVPPWLEELLVAIGEDDLVRALAAGVASELVTGAAAEAIVALLPRPLPRGCAHLPRRKRLGAPTTKRARRER